MKFLILGIGLGVALLSGCTDSGRLDYRYFGGLGPVIGDTIDGNASTSDPALADPSLSVSAAPTASQP